VTRFELGQAGARACIHPSQSATRCEGSRLADYHLGRRGDGLRGFCGRRHIDARIERIKLGRWRDLQHARRRFSTTLPHTHHDALRDLARTHGVGISMIDNRSGIHILQ